MTACGGCQRNGWQSEYCLITCKYIKIKHCTVVLQFHNGRHSTPCDYVLNPYRYCNHCNYSFVTVIGCPNGAWIYTQPLFTKDLNTRFLKSRNRETGLKFIVSFWNWPVACRRFHKNLMCDRTMSISIYHGIESPCELLIGRINA